MNISELQDFFAKVSKKLDGKFPDTDEKLRIMSQTVKLSEESGELAEQILLWSGGQLHKDKLWDKEAIAGEVADVIITVGTIAQELGIDIEDALQKKMEYLEAKRETL